MIEVRPAKKDDLERVSKLAGELVRMHHATDPDRFLMMPNVEKGYGWWLARQLENQDAVVLVATREGAIVGYSYGTKEERDWNNLVGEHGWIHDVYVDANERRSGAGRMLVMEMIGRLEALGARPILLATMVGNEAAQRLFAACGFRKTMVEMTR